MFFNLIMMAPRSTEGQQGGGAGIMDFMPIILIFVVLYFLILRPQARRQREHRQMLDVLSKGDKIVTSGGVHGVILKVNEKEGTILIKVADDVKLEIDRGAVARKIPTDR